MKLQSIIYLIVALTLISCGSGGSGGTANSNSMPPTTPSLQIVQTVPQMTSIQLNPAATNPSVAIGNLINSAQRTIDLEAYYFNNESNTPFAQDIMQNLLVKANSGVKVRIIVNASNKSSSLANGLSMLSGVPNITITYNDYFGQTGGIVHAKMLVADSQSFFIGSQNWDWIAFELNHELGVITTSTTLANQLEQVFNADFNNDPGYDPSKNTPSMPSGNLFVATSPNFNGLPSEIDNIVNLINNAKSTINIQAMVNQNYNPYGTPKADYWTVLQDALTNAANRGVKVNITVANWEFEPGTMFRYDNSYLNTMANIPNISVSYSSFPQNVGGVCVPYSAVDHAKYMIVDNKNVWIGTGNLAETYFTDTRDYSIFVINNPEFAYNINNIFMTVLNSPYTAQFFNPIPSPIVSPWCD